MHADKLLDLPDNGIPDFLVSAIIIKLTTNQTNPSNINKQLNQNRNI